jgi:hypothetical protein
MTARAGRAVLLVAALALGAFFAGLPGAHAQQTAVQISSASAEVGQQRAALLQALDVGAPGLGAWTVDVEFDPAVVSIVSCQAKQGGICNPSFASGRLRVTGTAIFGLQGNVALGNITFACSGVGASALAVSVSVLADATLGAPQDIDALVMSGSITCYAPGTSPQILGDVNCDGVVNAIDAQLVLQYVAQLIASLACLENADVDGDGAVSPIDAALILQMEAGLI